MNNHCYNHGGRMVCSHSQGNEKEIEGEEMSVCQKWNYLTIPLLAHTLHIGLIKRLSWQKFFSCRLLYKYGRSVDLPPFCHLSHIQHSVGTDLCLHCVLPSGSHPSL